MLSPVRILDIVKDQVKNESLHIQPGQGRPKALKAEIALGCKCSLLEPEIKLLGKSI